MVNRVFNFINSIKKMWIGKCNQNNLSPQTPNVTTTTTTTTKSYLIDSHLEYGHTNNIKRNNINTTIVNNNTKCNNNSKNNKNSRKISIDMEFHIYHMQKKSISA